METYPTFVKTKKKELDSLILEIKGELNLAW